MGFVSLSAITQRPDGTLVLTLERDDEKPRLVAVDREFRELWTRRLPLGALAGPPPWSRGLLFVDAHGEIFLVDDSGKKKTRGEIPVPPPFRNRSYRRAVIGQAAAGEWWIAIW